MDDQNGSELDQDPLEDLSGAASEDISPETSDGSLKEGRGWKDRLSGFFKRPKLWILISAGLIICSILAAGGWFFFLRGDGGEAKDAAETPAATETDAKNAAVVPPPAFPEIVELDPFEKLRLRPGGAMKTISLTLALEMADPAMGEELAGFIPKIRKVVEDEAAGMTWLTMRSAEGKLLFRFTLIRAVNRALPRPMVKDLYYKQLIMQ